VDRPNAHTQLVGSEIIRHHMLAHLSQRQQSPEMKNDGWFLMDAQLAGELARPLGILGMHLYMACLISEEWIIYFWFIC